MGRSLLAAGQSSLAGYHQHAANQGAHYGGARDHYGGARAHFGGAQDEIPMLRKENSVCKIFYSRALLAEHNLLFFLVIDRT